MANLKSQIFMIVLIILFGFLFFYRLGWNNLVSWDEAWYGTIAREIYRTGDLMHMKWNGAPYYDHPPMGFWLMAGSYKIFGINEFSTRLPSALLGLFSIILIYGTGIKLFGKKVIGFAAALVMGTAAWYIIRVRAGDLDSLFVFFYILTVYLSLKSSKNFTWFPLAMAAFGGLILSKTLVGLSAGLLIAYWNVGQVFRSKKNLLISLLGILVLAAVVLPWYYINLTAYPGFIKKHFIDVGIRKRTSLSSYFQLDPKLPLFYLHMGVRKWYYLWLASSAFLLVTLKFIKKPVFFLIFWNAVILYPFLTTSQTQIWHLIPVYLPMSLIIASGFYYGGVFAGRILHLKKLVDIGYLAFFLVLAFIQIKIFFPEVYPQGHYTPDDVKISRSAAKYDKRIYLNDDFLPIAAFYSGRDIIPLLGLTDEKRTMAGFFQSDENNFVMITRNWSIDNLVVAKIPYKILEKNNSFSIVTRP